MSTERDQPQPDQPPVATITDLPVDDSTRAYLDTVLGQYRKIKVDIKNLEAKEKEIKTELTPIFASIPYNRVLGSGWDLRRSTNTRRTINQDRLKIRLLEGGMGIEQIQELMEAVTDVYESESWAVYERKEKKKEVDTDDRFELTNTQ